jgi:uncharacterized membrane protein
VSDLYLYGTYADLLGRGLHPYTGFGFEYPPLALAPIAAGGSALLFGALMLGGALVAQHFVGVIGGRRAAWLMALAPLACGAMVRTHFDFLAVALVAAALAALTRERPVAGLALLGAGTMTKLFPVVLVPVALAWLWGRGEPAAARRGLVAFAAVVALVSAPFLSSAYLDAARFHVERPVQIESTPASVLFALGGSHVTGAPVTQDPYKSNGLAGGDAGAVEALFAIALALALAWIAARAAARPDRAHLLRCSFAAVLAFVVLGKVLSPQYMIWLVPFAALAWTAGDRLPAALTLAAVALTQVEFPTRYFDLVAGHDAVILVVAARNALLLAALSSLLARAGAPARWRPRAAAVSPG